LDLLDDLTRDSKGNNGAGLVVGLGHSIEPVIGH